jgi:hypothetical protein
LHDAVADTLVVQNRASRNANKPNWCWIRHSAVRRTHLIQGNKIF